MPHSDTAAPATERTHEAEPPPSAGPSRWLGPGRARLMLRHRRALRVVGRPAAPHFRGLDSDSLFTLIRSDGRTPPASEWELRYRRWWREGSPTGITSIPMPPGSSLGEIQNRGSGELHTTQTVSGFYLVVNTNVLQGAGRHLHTDQFPGCGPADWLYRQIRPDDDRRDQLRSSGSDTWTNI
jgi:hypothetical protein